MIKKQNTKENKMAKAKKNTVKNRAKDPQGEGSQEPFRGPYSLPRGHDHRLALASGWVDGLDGLLDDGGRLLRRPRVCEIRDAVSGEAFGTADDQGSEVVIGMSCFQGDYHEPVTSLNNRE